MNRRKWLELSVVGGASLVSSMTRGAARRLDRVGLQLYTVRHDMERDFEGTLRQVAEIGFAEVEFAGYFGKPSAAVRSLLDQYRLDAPSSHWDAEVFKGDVRPAIDAALAIGHRYLVCAWIPPEERSLDDYHRYAERFNRAGEACREAGLLFAYHNHDFEFVRDGETLPFDLLLEETDPALVKLEMDLYWITKGGGSPTDYFDRYPGRVHLLHIKDMDATPERSFTDPGRGIIDFPAILAHSAKAGVQHLFVENDEPEGSAFESARVGYEYLERLELP